MFQQNEMASNKQWARKNMGMIGNIEYRKEQMFLADKIRVSCPECDVKLEEPLENLMTIDEISCRFCVLDILVLSHSRKIAIRMMGEIHGGNKKTLKDEDQKIVLEGNGYEVKDVWWDEYPEFWNPTKFDEVQIDSSVRRILS